MIHAPKNKASKYILKEPIKRKGEVDEHSELGVHEGWPQVDTGDSLKLMELFFIVIQWLHKYVHVWKLTELCNKSVGVLNVNCILLNNNWENGQGGHTGCFPHGGWERGQEVTVPFHTFSYGSVVLLLKI